MLSEQDRLRLLDKDAQRTVDKVQTLANTLPTVYLNFLSQEDTLMVIGERKAATNIQFPGTTYSDEEFSLLKNSLRGVGLDVSKPDQAKAGLCFIYNPALLEAETASSSLAPPYRQGQDLDAYIKAAMANHYEYSGVMGKIFSFPEKAIIDFLHSQLSEDSTVIRRHDETYWFNGNRHRHIDRRESMKDIFFSALYRNKQFQQILNSQEIQAGEAEWSRRLKRQ